MPVVSVTNVDTAGGLVTPSGNNSFVRYEGNLIAVVGDIVQPHGSTPHNAAVMVEGSSFVKIDGIPVCSAGDLASCGDAITGSSNITIYE